LCLIRHCVRTICVNNLPVFPKFVQIDIRHKKLLQEIAGHFPPYSDFNFVSMFTWNIEGTLAIATLNENIIVRFSSYTGGGNFFSLLGINKITDTIDTLFQYCKEVGTVPELKLIGEAIIDLLPKLAKEKYVIKEDRDNHDYILSAINMSDLTKIHRKKRTKYNHFVRKHGTKAICNELNLDLETTHAEIKQLLVDWQKTRGRKDKDIEREFSAINRCLAHSKELNILGYGTYVSGELVAFTLFELVHNKTAMLHFGKTNASLQGSNEHLQYNLAKYLRILDVELMNNEQDLGIEGLRKSKEASLPVYFLKKYTIVPGCLPGKCSNIVPGCLPGKCSNMIRH